MVCLGYLTLEEYKQAIELKDRQLSDINKILQGAKKVASLLEKKVTN